MTEKLDKIVQRYDFLTEEISKPEVIADNNIWKKLVKEHSSLTPIVECYQELKKTQNELTANIELANVETDKDMLALLHEDIAARKSSLEELEEQLKIDFEEEPFDTVNGFVISRLEHIPEEGEDFEFEYEGYTFRILEVKDRMIQTVLARRITAESEQKPV